MICNNCKKEVNNLLKWNCSCPDCEITHLFCNECYNSFIGFK